MQKSIMCINCHYQSDCFFFFTQCSSELCVTTLVCRSQAMANNEKGVPLLLHTHSLCCSFSDSHMKYCWTPDLAIMTSHNLWMFPDLAGQYMLYCLGVQLVLAIWLATQVYLHLRSEVLSVLTCSRTCELLGSPAQSPWSLHPFKHLQSPAEI